MTLIIALKIAEGGPSGTAEGKIMCTILKIAEVDRESI